MQLYFSFFYFISLVSLTFWFWLLLPVLDICPLHCSSHPRILPNDANRLCSLQDHHSSHNNNNQNHATPIKPQNALLVLTFPSPEFGDPTHLPSREMRPVVAVSAIALHKIGSISRADPLQCSLLTLLALAAVYGVFTRLTTKRSDRRRSTVVFRQNLHDPQRPRWRKRQTRPSGSSPLLQAPRMAPSWWIFGLTWAFGLWFIDCDCAQSICYLDSRALWHISCLFRRLLTKACENIGRRK